MLNIELKALLQTKIQRREACIFCIGHKLALDERGGVSKARGDLGSEHSTQREVFADSELVCNGTLRCLG